MDTVFDIATPEELEHLFRGDPDPESFAPEEEEALYQETLEDERKLAETDTDQNFMQMASLFAHRGDYKTADSWLDKIVDDQTRMDASLFIYELVDAA